MAAPGNGKGVVPKKDEESTPLHIGSVLDSELICITVGAEKSKLWVHRATFEKAESHTLNQVISGKYKEGKGENGLDWSTEDTETVRRFLTYLYSGDYHVPKPEVKQVTAAAIAENLCSGGEGTGHATLPVYEQGKKSTKPESDEYGEQSTGLGRPLTPIQYHLEHVRLPTWRYNTDAGDLEHTPRTGKEFSFAEALVAHARLYVLAQYHLLRPLEILTLQRLTQVMVLAETHSYNIEEDVIPLIDFTYHTDDLDRPPDLRELVSQFVALHFHRFEGDEIFEILEAGGGFVRDVCSKLGRQLLANELKAGGGRQRVAQKGQTKNKGATRVNAPGNHRPLRPSALPDEVARWYNLLDNINSNVGNGW
ncbi:hypothetical protein TWF281_001683 [Arthrobotrys megalospora]